MNFLISKDSKPENQQNKDTNSLLKAKLLTPEGKEVTQYLSELCPRTKIYSLLFYSKLIPFGEEFLENLKEFIRANNTENFMQTVVCLCDEDIEDYNETFKLFKDFPCYLISFNSETKDNLIKTYNVFSLPLLILVEKCGKKFESFSQEDIVQFDSNTFKGWKNRISFSGKSKATKYSFGDKGRISLHNHDLTYTNYTGKSVSYGKGNYWCDVCRKSFKYFEPNFYCMPCGYDVCDACFEKNQVEAWLN